MTLANVFGGFKGAITKKLAKMGLQENFDDLIGKINRKNKKNRLAAIKELLVDKYEFDENSRTVTEISVDNKGRVGYYDQQLRDDSQDAFNIEQYGVPPGTFPNVDRLKHWIEAKGLMSKIKDPQLQYDAGGSNIEATRGLGAGGDSNPYGNTSSVSGAESFDDFSERREKILDRLAYLIGRKMEREGYIISQDADNTDHLDDFDVSDTEDYEVMFGADKIG